jgi:hypothetical protein
MVKKAAVVVYQGLVEAAEGWQPKERRAMTVMSQLMVW